VLLVLVDPVEQVVEVGWVKFHWKGRAVSAVMPSRAAICALGMGRAASSTILARSTCRQGAVWLRSSRLRR
jgi:hypothetical protein